MIQQHTPLHALPEAAEGRQPNTFPRLTGNTSLAIRRKRKFETRDVGQRGHRRHPSSQRCDGHQDAS